jgi:putative peptidoglycan lipid II flippase
MNLIKSTGTFSFFTLISRLLGYLRDVLIAIFLGSGPLADVFFVAFRIPNTFRRLFSEGTFNAAFIPSYSSELMKGKRKTQLFANKVFNILLFNLMFLVFIVEIFMPVFILLIAPGFSENSEKFNIAITLTRITFPFLFFVSLSSFFSAILNSHNKFAAASAAPIILNIILISVLLFGSYLADQLVYYLSYAVTIAGLVQLFFLLIFVKKYFLPNLSLSFKMDKNIKLFFNKLLTSILVGTIIASFEASAVSYLYYADRIYQINLAIAGIAIGTVLLPNLSKYIKNKNAKKIVFIQNKSLELSLFLSLPASMALLIASDEITSALFGYGSFDEIGVNNSALALFYFALGLPAFSLIKVFSSFLFARHNTKIPFYISLFSVILNASLSIYFFSKIGFIIIPIATTIASWFNALILFLFLRYKNYFQFNLIFLSTVPKIILSTTLMGYIFYLLINFFSDKLSYSYEFKLIYLILIVIFTFFVYLASSILTEAFKLSDIKLKY